LHKIWQPETRSDDDRSRWIDLVFQSHWSDPTLYVLERSYVNKNTIWSLIKRVQSCLAWERSREWEQKPGAVVVWTRLWCNPMKKLRGWSYMMIHKFQDGGRPPSWFSIFGHNFGVDKHYCTKFGIMMENRQPIAQKSGFWKYNMAVGAILDFNFGQ